MKTVFMGTPDYAVKTLEALAEAGHEIAAVFSQPDKPVGRKRVMTPPPVKVCAERLGIPVFQPQSLKNGEAAECIKKINPDVIVVVAYGKILTEEILALPKYGCVNGHASLLPKYRGAAPIQWAIINGESFTGVTTMLMDKGVDTGDILEQTRVEIRAEETAEELFERLSDISAQLTVSTVDKLSRGEITPIKQDGGMASYAPIIKKETALLDFENKTASEICSAVRGFYSWPCAFFFLGNKRIKVIKAREADKTQGIPATVINSDGRLIIACKDGTSAELLEISPEGSRPMSVSQFLNGCRVEVGTRIGGTDE